MKMKERKAKFLSVLLSACMVSTCAVGFNVSAGAAAGASVVSGAAVVVVVVSAAAAVVVAAVVVVDAAAPPLFCTQPESRSAHAAKIVMIAFLFMVNSFRKLVLIYVFFFEPSL